MTRVGFKVYSIVSIRRNPNDKTLLTFGTSIFWLLYQRPRHHMIRKDFQSVSQQRLPRNHGLASLYCAQNLEIGHLSVSCAQP